jgi:hypothetical protein
MACGHKTRSNIVRVLAVGLAVLSILFVAQVLSHSHANGQNEATCQVCHAAHVGSGPTINALLLAAPLSTSGLVREAVLPFHKQLFDHDSPSRAPPIA